LLPVMAEPRSCEDKLYLDVATQIMLSSYRFLSPSARIFLLY